MARNEKITLLDIHLTEPGVTCTKKNVKAKVNFFVKRHMLPAHIQK